jgi:hypothetical protein
VLILFNCFFVIRLIIVLKQELKNDEDLIEKYTSKLKWFPIIQIISFIPATINRSYEWISGNNSFFLTLIQLIFDTSTGLMFAVVYGFNPAVKQALSECFCSMFCKKRKSIITKTNSVVSINMNATREELQPKRSLTFIDEAANEQE